MNTATLTLPKLNDRVTAVHPETGKKVQVIVTKVLKSSFDGQDEKLITITGFTKWEPAKSEPQQVDFLSFQTDSLDTSELNKDELLRRAISEHKAITEIEREEAKLALFKLNHARNAGIYFKSFKAQCQHGEFKVAVRNLGVSDRTAQAYMQIATFWNVIEGKAQHAALLEESQILSIRWALRQIDEEKKLLKSAEPGPTNEELPLLALSQEQETPPPITEGSNFEVVEEGYFKGKNGKVTGFTANGNKAVVRFDPDNDGCSPSELIDLKDLNLKHNSVAEELDAKAESLGLTNGKSALPDLRDRALADKLNPTTVDGQAGHYPVEVIPQEKDDEGKVDEDMNNLSKEVIELIKYNAVGTDTTNFEAEQAINLIEISKKITDNASNFYPSLAANVIQSLIQENNDPESVMRLFVNNLSKESLQLLKKVVEA